VITPDAKDWTWVLDRPCPDCGFDASTCAEGAVAGLVRENAAAWEQLLTDGHLVPGRPDASTWSTLEYACHVRDVYERYGARIVLMLTEDDPLFPNWDQDASAETDRYDEQDPARVVAELRALAEGVAERLERLAGEQWVRPGRRSDGASFTMATLSRYMIHDPLHHVWDVTA
jgi:hypothetical protein